MAGHRRAVATPSFGRLSGGGLTSPAGAGCAMMLIATNTVGAQAERGPIGSCRLQPFCRALISSNLASACSNLALKSHIASRISRKVADVLALSAFPKAKMLLFRRYPMILGSEIL